MKPHLILSTIITFFLLNCGTGNNSKDYTEQPQIEQKAEDFFASDLIFDRIDGTKLIFKDGTILETNLFELSFIGNIYVSGKAPYLIFSGKDCEGCDANISIYIHSPSDGHLEVEHGQNRFKYPGIERDYENDSIIYSSRAFFGEVLKNKQGVIWYQNILLENGEFAPSIFLTRLVNGKMKDTVYSDNGSIEETIELVRKGLCKEIEGKKYTSEP